MGKAESPRRIVRNEPSFLPLALAALLLLPARPALPATFSVDSAEDRPDLSPGDALCLTEAGTCTLRAAVMEANALPGDDAIVLGPHPYLLALPGSGDNTAAAGDLDITSNLELAGAGPALTVVDGGGLDRVFHILDPAGTGVHVEIRGMTITGGYALNENGGAILLGSTEEESGGHGGSGGGGGCGSGGGSGAGGGGGGCGAAPGTAVPAATPEAMVCEEGGEEGAGVSLYLLDCRVTGNAADSNLFVTAIDNATGAEKQVPVGGSGGGIASGGSLKVEKCTLEGNVAVANGGGIYSSAALELLHSSVRDNEAEGGGGLFDTGSHDSWIKGCTFSGNHATGGGAISTRAQVYLQITNSTLSGNTAKDTGAGLHCNGTVALIQCTVAFNRILSNSEGEDPGGSGGSGGCTASPLAGESGGCDGGGAGGGGTGEGSGGCGGDSGGSGGKASTGAGINSFARGGYSLRNTILVGNLAGDRVANCGKTGGGKNPFAYFFSQGYNLEDADTCGLDQPGDRKNVSGPVLADTLAPNGSLFATLTHALVPGSPAIDAIPAESLPVKKDQRGFARSFDPKDPAYDPRADIGAVEYYPHVYVTPSRHDFGAVPCGHRETVEITILDPDRSGLSLAGLSLGDPENFLLDVYGGSNPCGSLSPAIPPGGSCTVTVAFCPDAIEFLYRHRTACSTTLEVLVEEDSPSPSAVEVSLSGTSTNASGGCSASGTERSERTGIVEAISFLLPLPIFWYLRVRPRKGTGDSLLH